MLGTIILISQWQNGDSERLSDLPKVTQVLGGRGRIQTWHSGSMTSEQHVLSMNDFWIRPCAVLLSTSNHVLLNMWCKYRQHCANQFPGIPRKTYTDAPQFMMRLPPNKPITNRKSQKSKVHFIHLAYRHHNSAQPTFSVLRTLTWACRWAKSPSSTGHGRGSVVRPRDLMAGWPLPSSMRGYPWTYCEPMKRSKFKAWFPLNAYCFCIS